MTQYSIYKGDFCDWSDVASNFRIGDIGEPVAVYADYDCPSYEGYANVYYVEGGKLYHVYGSHCSCYGLEGMWEPDEMTIESVRRIFTEGSRCQSDKAERLEWLDRVAELVK